MDCCMIGRVCYWVAVPFWFGRDGIDVGVLVIEGGVPLIGEVQVSGAKNGILPLLAACLLAEGELVLSNAPSISDVETMAAILSHLGVDCSRGTGEDSDKVSVSARYPESSEVPYDLAREIRGSVFLFGPLLARTGEARIAFPGGDDLGARPIDIHIEAMMAMGAEVRVEHGYVVAKSSKLSGTRYLIDPFRSRGTSVGATHNLMMAGCLARGVTVIENAAREPEVVDLAIFLNSMGARIRGAGTDVIKVEGGGPLKAQDHAVLPDRIEAGSYLIAGAMTGGDVLVDGISPQYLRILNWALGQAGCKVEEYDSAIRVSSPRPGRLRATNIMTFPYPGFPTDLQAPFAAAMTSAEGTSIVSENIYDSRFAYVDELGRMGADIKVVGNKIIVTGVPRLSGAPVEGSDIRAVVALVLAGLVADGVTRVHGLRHLDRGYERMEAKLKALGAQTVRAQG